MNDREPGTIVIFLIIGAFLEAPSDSLSLAGHSFLHTKRNTNNDIPKVGKMQGLGYHDVLLAKI